MKVTLTSHFTETGTRILSASMFWLHKNYTYTNNVAWIQTLPWRLYQRSAITISNLWIWWVWNLVDLLKKSFMERCVFKYEPSDSVQVLYLLTFKFMVQPEDENECASNHNHLPKDCSTRTSSKSY